MRVEKTGRTAVILKWSRRIRWTLMLLVLAYASGVCLYVGDATATYLQTKAAIANHAGTAGPEIRGSPYSSRVAVPSAAICMAWWLPAENADAPSMLYLHGNDKNISGASDLERATRLRAMGYNLLMVDYRGYGKSTGGEPSEAKMYEDAEAAWNYLIQQRVHDPKRIFIYGHSLGGAIAIDLATHHPEAAGIIAESTFTDMVDMGKREYPYLPVEQLLNQRFDSISKVGKLKIPLLLIHGTWDRLIPYQMSQRLFDSAPQPKFLKLIEGGEHNNDAIIAPLEYRAAVSEFTARYLAPH